MKEPRRGYIQIPRAALDYGIRTPEVLAAVVNLYLLADSHRWEPFEASQRFLAARWGLSKGRAERIIRDLQGLELIAVDPGSRDASQRLNVHRGADHLLDHPIDHPVDHLLDHPIDHPNRSTAPPPKKQIDHPVDHLLDHPIDHPIDHPVDQRVKSSLELLEQLKPARTTPQTPQGGLYLKKAERKKKRRTKREREHAELGIPLREVSADEVREVWSQISDMRMRHTPGARNLKLTADAATKLRERLEEHDAESILSAWAWWLTCPDDGPSDLRADYGVITFLRASNHTRYQVEAQAWQERIESGEPSSRASEQNWAIPEDYKPKTEAERDLERRANIAYRDSLDESRIKLAAEMRENGRVGRLHYTAIEAYERQKHGIVNGGILPSVEAAERAKDDVLNPCPF